MGTDAKLVLAGKKIDGITGDLCMAHLGRKHSLGCYGEPVEEYVNRLWPKVTMIEETIKKRVAVVTSYTPKDFDELESIQAELELEITNWVEDLVNFGRKIMLANILHDSAGYLKIKDS